MTPQEHRRQIGKKIEELRKKQGLSQITLAEKLGVQQSTVSKIENGDFSVSLDYLYKIGQVLGFTIELKENGV